VAGVIVARLTQREAPTACEVRPGLLRPGCPDVASQ
jgi:hypothetical protein